MTTTLKRGTPLSGLFVLIGACALLIVLGRPVFHEMVSTDRPRPDYWPLNEFLAIAIISIAALTSSVVGASIGMRGARRIRGFVMGLVVGGAVGAVAAAQFFIPSDALALCMGSIAIVLFGIVVRLRSGSQM